MLVHDGGEAGALDYDGDEIEVDVPARRIHRHVTDEELDERRQAWVAPEPHFQGGYGAMFQEHVLPASRGCDFDFVLDGPKTPDPQIFL